jgi:hypothetical protein
MPVSHVGDPRIFFDFAGTERELSINEARILRDWLRLDRTLSAVSLVGRIEVEITAEVPSPIAIDRDDITALQSALCDTDVGNHPGLLLLKEAVCGVGVDAGPIDGIDDRVGEPER